MIQNKKKSLYEMWLYLQSSQIIQSTVELVYKVMFQPTPFPKGFSEWPSSAGSIWNQIINILFTMQKRLFWLTFREINFRFKNFKKVLYFDDKPKEIKKKSDKSRDNLLLIFFFSLLSMKIAYWLLFDLNLMKFYRMLQLRYGL